jgi:hypothetical protein
MMAIMLCRAAAREGRKGDGKKEEDGGLGAGGSIGWCRCVCACACACAQMMGRDVTWLGGGGKSGAAEVRFEGL